MIDRLATCPGRTASPERSSARHQSSAAKLLKHVGTFSLPTVHRVEGGTVSLKSGVALCFSRFLATKEASPAGRIGPVHLHGHLCHALTGDRLHCGPFAQLGITGWELRKSHVVLGISGSSETIAFNSS